MDYEYPLDVQELLRHARARGSGFLQCVGLDKSMPDHWVLGRIARRATTGWFPYTARLEWHGGMDIGLTDWGGDTIAGMAVTAIAEGHVAAVEADAWDGREFVLGRVIVEHKTPDGEIFYAQYKHVDAIEVYPGQRIACGEQLGTIGFHGDLPHLELSIASSKSIGGDDLGPEIDFAPHAPSQGAWHAMRARVRALDVVEWPIDGLRGKPGYVYEPVEFVRHCRQETRDHDAGPGSVHEVDLVTQCSPSPISPGTNVVQVAAVLKSTPLRKPEFEELVRTRSFPAIEEKHADKAVVTGIQLALRKAGYPKLPANGVFGPQTTAVVKAFQEKQLKRLLSTSGQTAIPGKTASDVQVTGKVDWLTLIGLDACASAHAHAKTSEPSATGASAPAPPATPPAPAAPENTFDATGGLSIHFGVRMYKAMLEWIWRGDWDEKNEKLLPKGVGYSTCNEKYHRGTEAQVKSGDAILLSGFKNEWPDVRLEKAKIADATVGTVSYPRYQARGLTWLGSDFTNCCNSQLAALAVALGGKEFGIKGGSEFGAARGAAATPYDMTQDVQRVKVKVSNKATTRGALHVFETMFVNNDEKIHDPAGKSLLDPVHHGAHICAIAAFGMGEKVAPWSSKKIAAEQANLKKMLIGDPAATNGHAFMIGDVRYGVWVKQASPPAAAAARKSAKAATANPGPQYVVDQSSFIDSEDGTAVELNGKDAKSATGRDPLTKEQCDWLLKKENEMTYLRRVAAFLAKDPTSGQPAGKMAGNEVVKIEVVCWRCLTANGFHQTAHAVPYKGKGPMDGKRETGPFERMDDRLAQAQFRSRDGVTVRELVKRSGITCPWTDNETKKISLGRFYAPLAWK